MVRLSSRGCIIMSSISKKMLQAAAGGGSIPHLMVVTAANNYLAFYDISGGEPQFLSSFYSSDYVFATDMRYDAARSYLYVLSDSNNKLITINISDTSNPVQAGSYSTGNVTGANGLAYISSSEVILTGTNNLVSALDISDPTSVSSLSTVSVSSPGYGGEGSIVYDSGTYAWLFEDSVIRTLNVSNLNSISSSATKVDTTNLAGSNSAARPMFLDSDNDILLTAVSDPVGLSTWSISNPTSVSHIDAEAVNYPNAYDFSLIDRICVAAESSQIEVFSISTSGAITSLGTQSTMSGQVRGVIYNPNTEYVHIFKRVSTTESNIHTYDVSNPSSISFVSTKNIYSDVPQSMATTSCQRAFDLANL